MRRQLLFLSIASAIATTSNAQVQDISVIIAPTAGYNWFDAKSTVDNGFMYGLQAGFGFGKVIELRGIYEKSADLKQNFGQYQSDIQTVIPGFTLSNRSVRVSRTGGEFKANIPAKGFAPYFLLGTGVQKFERTVSDSVSYVNKNLYASAGLGIKLSLGARTTLNLEGRGLVYNMNPSSLLYNEGGNSDFDTWVNNQDRTRMYNWSAQAALQFYLGGRNDQHMTAMDKAYLNRFSGGLSGFKVTLAPVGAYVDFNTNSGYRNTYMLGGMLGMEITNFVGLRAYYYQATKGANPSLDFDKMGMYGLDFVGNLNVARGIIPYITVGGGYLNIEDGYLGRNVGTTALPVLRAASSSYFAKGGVGLTLPLGKYVDAFGAANLFYTMDNTRVSVADLRNTDQLQQHVMYNVGFRLKLGKNAQTQAATSQAFNAQFADERFAYEQKLSSLEKELQEAYKNNDIEKVTQIMEEKKAVETVQNAPKDSLIRMTPAQLESLIEKTVNSVNSDSAMNLENRLERMEMLLQNMNQNQGSGTYQNRTYYDQYPPSTMPNTTTINGQSSAVDQKLLDEIAQLKSQIQVQNANINALKVSQAVLQAQPESGNDIIETVDPVTGATSTVVVKRNINNANNSERVAGVVLNRGLSIYGGLNVGDATTFNIGLRMNYGFSNTRLMFMPEAYVALGDKDGFGISANAVYPFKIGGSNFTPYLGLGLGLHNLGGAFSFNPNYIAGTSYALNKGSLFADYTVRGAFRNNQIALGYRFNF